MTQPTPYIKAPQTFLEVGVPLKASIFLLMPSDNRYVLFRKKGQELALDDIFKLKEILPERICVLETEYKEAVQGIAAKIAEELSGNPDGKDLKVLAGSALKGMVLAKKTDPTIAKQMTERILEQTSQVLASVVVELKAVEKKKPRYREIIQKFVKETDPLSNHNKHVSALAGLILMSCGSTIREEHVADIVFAGLVHDICLDQVPVIFMNKHLGGGDLSMQSLLMFSREVMVNNYQRHIELSLQRLTDLGIPTNDDVRAIITQHHENLDGSGLYGLKALDLFISSRVLRIADDIMALIHSTEKAHTLDSAVATLTHFNNSGGKKYYDPEILTVLKKIIDEEAS